MIDRLIGAFFRFYVILLFGFIFAPFVTLVAFAFNTSRFPYLPWQGFTLDWFRSLNDAAIIAAFGNSVLVATLTAVIATPLGCTAAYCLNRWDFRGKSAYLAFLVSPPCIPLIIVAVTLLIYLRQLGVSKTLAGVVISHVVLAAPFALGVMRLRLAELDSDLERAAWNLGANEFTAIRTIVLPQVWPAVIAAFLLSMSVSWDEFIVSWFVSGLDITLPVYLWNRFQGQISAQINAIGSVAFFVSIMLVVIVELILFRPGKTHDEGE
ncbi:MAG: ABC transporter permease [Parvibaculaceae bacterium]